MSRRERTESMTGRCAVRWWRFAEGIVQLMQKAKHRT
jgi:hypothetical protein